MKKELSFGEQLVGVSFNPSENPDVDKVKKMCAELADMVHNYEIKSLNPAGTITQLSALMHLKDASMNAVKLLTMEI